MSATDDAGNESIHLNGGSGDIILRNADAAEQFEVAEAVAPLAGLVMTLGDDGKIRPSDGAYNSRVIGVIAGAGNYRPGIVLDHRDAPSSTRAPISVMGKVSCRATTESGPIRPGDLLTTSSRPGLAMRAANRSRAFGAVIGKALTRLDDETGMVDMIISLQ